MTTTDIIIWITIAILLLFSAFFSSSETALFALDEIRLKKIKKRKGLKRIKTLLADSSVLLVTLLLGNTMVNVALSSLMERQLGVENYILSISVVTALLLFFGEISPKTLALSHIESFALFNSRFLLPVYKVFKPVAKPLARFSNFLLKRLEKFSRKNDPDRDDKHIDALISIVSRGGFLDKDEKHLIERVLRFAQMEVRNIMTPRTGLVSVEKHAPIGEAISLMQHNRFSKIPVFNDTDDNIVGVIYLKDVIKFILHPELTGKKAVKDFTNQMYYVPETKKLSEMLEDFQNKKIRIAAVVDEYGSAIGIVTIADVLGEIVGEFVDESFDINKKVVRVTAKKYIVLGDIDIEDFNHFFGTDFSSEEYESLAGFVIEQAGDIPPAGYVLEVGKHRITVRSRTANHIDKLLVEKK